MNDTIAIWLSAVVELILMLAGIGGVYALMVQRITKVETNMDWVMSGLKILGDKAGVVLHSPHTPEFDKLIEKLWESELTQEEARILCSKLSKIIHEDPANPLEPGKPYSPGHKSTATQMLVAVSTICRVDTKDFLTEPQKT